MAFNFKPVHVEGCIPAPMRRTMEQLAANSAIIAQLFGGDVVPITVQNSQTLQGETPSQLHDAGNLTGSLPAAVFNSGNIYVEGTLTSDLAANGTQTVDGRTISGKAIRSTYEIPSGATFGAIWNGTNYTLIWANQCERLA